MQCLLSEAKYTGDRFPKLKNFALKMLSIFRAGVPNRWYAYHWWYTEAFQVVREMFSKNAKKVFVFTETLTQRNVET